MLRQRSFRCREMNGHSRRTWQTCFAGHGAILAGLSLLLTVPTLAAAPGAGCIVVTDFVAADGNTDVADAIQRVIDAHPNRTLYFPDGTYLLSHPIATPAHPKKSVDLQLANFAILKAAPGWTNAESMVRLGGIHPANDIRTPGSVYSLTGGIIDGSGVADGVSIDSGRETRVRLVSMKNVRVGLHIKHGANSNSSDSDISDVNITGNRKSDSVGVFIESCDNTIANMRIAHVCVGIRLAKSAGGNLMKNLHPLCTIPMELYDGSVGFEDNGRNNRYDTCYSDHFSTGFLFGKTSGNTIMDACIAYWYAPSKGRRHTAIKCLGKFRAQVGNMQIGFRGAEAVNTVLEVAEDGGLGYLRDPRIDQRLVRKNDLTFRKYLNGVIH